MLCLSPGLLLYIFIRGFRRAYEWRDISDRAYNWNRKSTQKQVTAVLIKNCFAFTGFSKHHKNQIHFNESKIWAYVCWGGGGGEWRHIIVCTFFPGRWACNFGAYKWQFMVIYVIM